MPKERGAGGGGKDGVPADPGSASVANAHIARVLLDLADAMEIGGAGGFRVRAYRSAARSVENLAVPAAEIAAEGGAPALKKLPSVGGSMAAKILEIIETGTLAQLKQIRREVPEELTALLGIQGLGPKKLHVLHHELGINNLADLEAAARAGKLAPLAGFGKKSQEKVLKSIAQYRRHLGRFRLDDVEAVALPIQEQLGELPGVEVVEIAGSFRRGRETVGDLDLLCVAADPGTVMAAFTELPGVDEVIASGDTKTSVRLENGLQVDLRVVEREAFGAALHYFTGSKEHNVVIRGLAREAGLKVNEYGVFKGDERIAGRTETDVFGALDLPYIPPELRENRGELDAARDGTLPQLVEVGDILGDLQMHTTGSDGRDSAAEMAEAARALGRTYIGITDHSKAVAVAGGLNDAELLAHTEELRKVDVPGVRVLASVEVDILKDGSLDLRADTLQQLDLVVASVHSHMEMPREEMTQRVIRAVESGWVHILAHPTGRLLNQRDGYEVDMQAVIAACVRQNVALEINAHPYRLDLSDVHARLARDKGARIVISTDAHSTEGLALMRFGVKVARRAWLAKEHVLNTLPPDEFLASLRRRPGKRQR